MSFDENVARRRNNSNNMYSILVGILVVSSAILAFVPSVTAQSMGQLEPPYSDYGFDTDLPPDGLFNYLVVNVSVNVTQPGDFFLMADLYDSTGIIYITDTFNATSLDVGVHLVPIWFSGYSIRFSGIDGPYSVEIFLFNDFFMMIDSDTYVTSFYLADDFQTAPAEFFPPHSDYGLDTDGNTLFNYLVIDVVVDVSEAGFYDVDATLFDGTGMIFIDFKYNFTYLDVGLQTVEIRYRGYIIYFAGVDGPYRVELELYDDDRNFLGNDTHMTQAYLYTNFEQTLPAEFLPPHSDYGLDADGDTLYDFLVVDVVVNVSEAGFYEAWGDLYDITGMIPITGDFYFDYLDPGLQTVELRFSGYDIYTAGIDGPYMVDLQLYDDEFNFLDNDTHMTNPYSSTEFDPPPGQFSPPHSDYGLDTDVPSDGYFNYLVLNASVDINEAGMFLVQGILFDSTMTLQVIATNFTQLDVGLQTVELWFSGASIYLSGFDGPYEVILILGAFVGEEVVVVDDDFYVTNPYNYTDFQPVNPGMIWGYVYEAVTGSPVSFAAVQAMNYTHGYMNTSYTDPTGYYEMNVFEGEFYVLLDGPESANLQSNLTVVSVVGSTEVTTYLEEPPPMNISSNVSFMDWDNLSLSAEMDLEEDNQTFRLMIDFTIGNRDGYVDQGELDLFMGLVGEPPEMFQNTTEMFKVDGIHYDLDPTSFQYGASGEGPVTLKVPLSIYVAGNFTSNTTIPVSPSHLIELNVTYDTDEEESVGYMNIPTDYILDNFDPVLNISISGLGTSTIVFDPLGDPDPGDGIGYVWVNLTVTTTMDMFVPEIRDVFIDGSSMMTYNLSALPMTFDLTAIVDDSAAGNSTIGGANYTTPTPTSWPGAPMTAMDGVFDAPVEDINATVQTPTSPGIYNYYVYAWDNISNYNNSAPYATLTIVDDLPPEISEVAIDGQTTVTYYLSSLPSSITLTAIVNDTNSGNSTIGGANYTTPTSISWPGTTMTATDGAFDEPIEDVNVTIPTTPTLAGTYNYYVYAWDNISNYNNSAPYATLTIVDDLPPEISEVAIDGQTTVTYYLSSLPSSITLTAIVNDTNSGNSTIGGANYTTPTATSWPGTPMEAEDGVFDSPVERVTLQVALPTQAGTYNYYVYAWDTGEGYNNSAPFAALTIVDDLPPEISNVRVDGQTTVTVKPGTDVVLTATIGDTDTGSSNIQGANYTIGTMNWPGIPMNPTDGSFDSAQEDVDIAIDTAGWAEGSYQVCVYATDEAQGYNTTSVECAEIVIDETPPSISDVLVEPDPQDAGEEVAISASITDASGIAEVRIEIKDPEGNVLGNFSMTYDSVAEKYEYSNAYDEAGTYTFTIWATDEAGNMASESGDFRIREEAPAGFIEQYWWVILIVVIIVVVVAVVLAGTRKPKVEEEIPPPPEEEVPEEIAEETVEEPEREGE
ncbi:MAG: Ig-like domain repeat protein [Thermoplasmata archaeon]